MFVRLGRRPDTRVAGHQWFVSVEQRRVEVVTGAGLRGVLTDDWIAALLDRQVVPRLRAGQLEQVRYCTLHARSLCGAVLLGASLSSFIVAHPRAG